MFDQEEEQMESADASAKFSRQRSLPLLLDDDIPPLHDTEVESHEVI
jgi:hypothetical protein